jgi:hypothetical protein
MKNSSGEELQEQTPSAGATLIYSYNLIDTTNVNPGSHMNWLQWGGPGGTITSPIVSYNTSFQTSVGGAEGYQWYGGFSGCGCSYTLVAPSLDHNVEIALPSGGTNTMSYINHGSAGAETNTTSLPVAHDNYIDPTGTISGTSVGAFYPGSFQAYSSGLYSGPTWSFSNNWNMATGVALSNTPP